MSKRYKWFGLFAVCIMVLGSMILLNEKVYAAQLNDTKELKEAYANAVWRCYAQDFLKKEVNKEDLTFDSDKLDPASLMSDGAGNFYNGDYYWSYSGQRNITCKDSFDKGVKQNVFDMFKGSSVYPSARNDELTAFMEHLGYSADTKNMEGAIGFCYRNDEYQKIKNCFYWPNEKSLLEDPNENKKLVSADRSQGISDVNVSLINKEISFSLNFWDQNSGIQRPKCYVKYSNNWSFESGHCGNGNYWDYIKFENFTPNVDTSKDDAAQKYYIPPDGNPDVSTAYKTFRQWLIGSGELKAFTLEDIALLYAHYFNESGATFMDASKDSSRCFDDKPDNGRPYAYTMTRGKEMKWCEMDTTRVSGDIKYPGFNITEGTDTYYFLNKEMTFDELIEEMNKLHKNNEDVYKDITDKVDLTDSNIPPEKDLCYTSAGPMGWMLCPAIVAASGLGGAMWDQVEANLQFKTNVLENNGPVNQGWEAMTKIANIIFIILFMLVIFSQLTGLGIDNYGIKKILPKLIVIAILINLSFVLCRILVDLSNILGVGLQNLLSSVAPKLPDTDATGGTVMMAVGGVTGLAIAGFGIGWLFKRFSSETALSSAFGSIAIYILGAVIIAVIGILMVFIILGIRQAGIVISVVLAPIAVVCYALPNTEKIFKKWVEVFKALLIVYPICGAMVGAGKFASSILFEVNPLLAMIANVIPYFFIPVALKNSLNAVGNIGGRIQTFGRNFGRRASGAATGAIRNTKYVKDRFQYQNALQKNRRSKARYEHYKDIDSDWARYRASDASYQTAAFENQREKQYGDAFDRMGVPELQEKLMAGYNGNDSALVAAAQNALSNKGAYDELFKAMEGADWSKMDENVRNRALQSLQSSNSLIAKSFAKYRNNKGTAGFKDWASGNIPASESGIKSSSLRKALFENGSMNGLNKDEMKLIGRTNLGGMSPSEQRDYGRMLTEAMIKANDSKTRVAARDTLTKNLENGTIKASDLAIKPTSFASMGESDLRAIANGLGGEENMRKEFASQIEAAKADSMIWNNVDDSVKKILINLPDIHKS